MRIYVAGKMTGLPDVGFPAFNEAAEYLRSWGYEVENPADNPSQRSWSAYMKQAIPQMLTCDAIALLDNWQDSRGARLESHIAEELGMVRMYL